MSDTKLQLKAKDPSGAATNLNVTNVNPNASDANMLTFTQSLNALTKNTYVQTNKIITTALDTEGDNRATNPATISVTSIALADVPSSEGQNTITINNNSSTGKVSIKYVTFGFLGGVGTASGYTTVTLLKSMYYVAPTETQVALIVHIDGDDNYKPADLEITITV